MHISSKTLLNSAEGILREKREEKKYIRNEDHSYLDKSENSPGSSVQGTVASRILTLQDSLGDTQDELSREQARHAFLTGDKNAINSSLKFDGKPLFPDWKYNTEVAPVLESVLKNIDNLARKLKQVQVEMENIYALNFISKNASSEIADVNTPIRNLNPERVSKLTKE